MIIFPAIDLYNKEVVRLQKGKFESAKTYTKDPLSVAKKFEEDGATWLHIIDLNGAQDGTRVNREVIQSIVKNTSLKVQVGGGIRSIETIREYLALGISRVILGSFAVKNLNILPIISSTFKEKVIVSVDSLKGNVTYSGWQDTSSFKTVDFCKKLENIGIKTIVYTDIDKDGMLEGTDVNTINEIQNNTKLNVIASGGVTTINDITSLMQINTYGAIIGKALYEDKISLKEVIECSQEE